MESTKSANEIERPELSDSDIRWLQETIGIEIFRDYNWNSIDYAIAFECYFERNEKCQLNARNEDGNTPLHLAAISDNYKVIDALLMSGADVNALNNVKQTPVTFSEQYPDYSVGFQFFRHLHKLDFLEQEICKENSDWFCKVRKIYNEKYPHDRHIAAFTHNPFLDKEIILNIRADGEEVIYQMYRKELQKFQHAQSKRRPLSQILKLTNRENVAVNNLKELKKYMRYPKFYPNYPLFGFMFKRKYRQSVEYHNICRLEHESPLGSPGKSLKDSDKRQVNGMYNMKSLKIETERCMQEFKEFNKETDQRKAAEARSFSERDVTSNGVVDNSSEERNNLPKLSSNEKLERLRKMMPKQHTK